jgi:MerR family transcriptional regulator, light-induced transcriptional regulator
MQPAARHRSGAVARMLRMPVATLRVWERRYAVTQPALSESGQRLYSADDVRRLAMLKQLTDLGHAIGSLAGLDMAQLQQVASTHAGMLAARVPPDPVPYTAPSSPPWRVAVIGAALATRLQRPALLRLLPRPLLLRGPFADAAQAAAALRGETVDALLVHEPRLHDGWLAGLQAAAPSLAALPKAVLYRFAAEHTCAALGDSGTALLREPQSDTALGQWLQGVLQARPPALSVARGAAKNVPVQPRRWDDAALADFAGLSSTIACECPRHVAELLIQLSHFEAYSAECRHRSPADAELHAFLQQVAATSRARFEAALEHVALHEGLTLPPSAQPARPAPRPPRAGGGRR